MVYANHKNGKVGDGGSYCLTNIRGTNLVKRKARLARKIPRVAGIHSCIELHCGSNNTCAYVQPEETDFRHLPRRVFFSVLHLIRERTCFWTFAEERVWPKASTDTPRTITYYRFWSPGWWISNRWYVYIINYIEMGGWYDPQWKAYFFCWWLETINPIHI